MKCFAPVIEKIYMLQIIKCPGCKGSFNDVTGPKKSSVNVHKQG